MNFNWSEDEEDDDILALASKPPRLTQLGVTQSQMFNSEFQYDSQSMEKVLMKAQGEVGMLRNKIQILENEKLKNKEVAKEAQIKLEDCHRQELEKLKWELQRLEDEKQFFILEKRQLMKDSNSNLIDKSLVSMKKRKIEEVCYIELHTNRIIQDEPSLFAEYLIEFSLPSCKVTVFKILKSICLENKDLEYDFLTIKRGESIGEGIEKSLYHFKKFMKLDELVDKILEIFASLIRDISTKGSSKYEECRFALPFLLCLMFQSISFRPSAVYIDSLKDVFQFISDFITTYQSFLKIPLHRSTLELDVKPDIFQYEFIDNLILLYSFDILEICIKMVQGYPEELQKHFFDQSIISNITEICQISLTISYKSILNVVYNTIEILNGLIQIEIDLNLHIFGKDWWEDILTKLYTILNKKVDNENLDDNRSLVLLSEFNISGLIRCIGDNGNSWMLMELINLNEQPMKVLPNVIYKEFNTWTQECKYNIEGWCLNLQNNVIRIFQKLLLKYGKIIINKELINTIIDVMMRTQELNLTICIGNESINDDLRNTLILELVKFFFHLWIINDDTSNAFLLRDYRDQLIACFSRIVFCDLNNDYDPINTKQNILLINSFKFLKIEDSINYYNDSLEEIDNESDINEFIEDELNIEKLTYYKDKLNIGHQYKNYKEMTKFILERITLMEDFDSLYSAMSNK